MAVNKTSPSKKKYYETYKATHRREKNKIRKILKHLKRHPNDQKSLDYCIKLQQTYK